MNTRGAIQPRWWWLLLGLVLAGILGRAAWIGWRVSQRRAAAPAAQLRDALQQALRHGPPPPPVYGAVPDFTLTDHHGRPLARKDLAGRIWIADFIFTRCAGQCLTVTSHMASLQERLPAEVRLISFSVDPAHDTPDVLAGYAARAGAGERWLFLTGSRDDIFRLSRDGFHLSVEEEGGTPEEPIVHSVRFVLVDRAGGIRGYYDATESDDINWLFLDVAMLLKPAPSP